MQASHILLGRPWQFDRRVTHDSFTNKYSFKMNGRTINLLPMSPNEVYKDKNILSEWIILCLWGIYNIHP